MFDIDGALLQLQEQHLLRKRKIVSSAQGPSLVVDGQPCLSFCSNDYLGLANHPVLKEAAILGLEHYGVGAGASAVISGHSAAHEALEVMLANFVGMSRALYFSNGYMANIGIIPALVDSGDVVFSDRLNHACLIDGARLSRAEFKVYPHGDAERLATLLAKSTHPNKLVVTDAVFSMDGDIAPLADILALCERYDARLVVDDAHGFGVLGQQGRGTLSHLGITSDRLIYMGTLGKAAGVYGAFVAAHANMIEWLLQRARTYIYTTASPAFLATALMASIKVIEQEQWRRDQLQLLARRLKERLAGMPWQLLPSDTAIQPLIVGDNVTALRLMDGLRTQGIWVPAIRPPTVPKGTARLRISLSAAHTEAHIDQLSDALIHMACLSER